MHSDATKWYSGPTLMEHLESVELDQSSGTALDFRMPVQWVNRPNLDFRGFSGTVASAPSNLEMRCVFYLLAKPVK